MMGAEALYRPRKGIPGIGRPGVLILPDNPSTSAVVEELIHLGQDRNSGWTLYDKMVKLNETDRRILQLELEIEAKEKLLVIGERLNFPIKEMNQTRRRLGEYTIEHWELRGY
jgi:hypothetical protein